MAEFHLTNKAVEDLSDIWNYTFDEWSEKQADEYYNILVGACRKIAGSPELFGKQYDDIMRGLRGARVNKHIVFYRILDGNYVEIVRILHERMDLQNGINR